MNNRWKRPRRAIGLGDMVHSVANPVAVVIDRVVGSQIATCKGCAARRESLNATHEKIHKHILSTLDFIRK